MKSESNSYNILLNLYEFIYDIQAQIKMQINLNRLLYKRKLHKTIETPQKINVYF